MSKKRSLNGPNTDARDQLSPDRHIRLAPHGRSIQKYMVKRCGPPSQGWRTFLRNHAPDIAAMDLFVRRARRGRRRWMGSDRHKHPGRRRPRPALRDRKRSASPRPIREADIERTSLNRRCQQETSCRPIEASTRPIIAMASHSNGGSGDVRS